MIINKKNSDKTFFPLTNYNGPNLYQFHLPFLSLMPYPLKNLSSVHNFNKKKVTSSIVDMVMVANCYKLSLVRVLNFQSVPSKCGVFKKLVLTPWKIHWGRKRFHRWKCPYSVHVHLYNFICSSWKKSFFLTG